MSAGNKDNLGTGYINLAPRWAKDPQLRSHLEDVLRQATLQEIPKMVSRLAEIEPLITIEMGEYSGLVSEADRAFQHGLWYAVVALNGVAAETFSNHLYDQIVSITSPTGKQEKKDIILGDSERGVPEQRKLAILKFFDLITPASYDKLLKMKKLRDIYAHGAVEGRDIGKDARYAMRLFRGVLKERFEARHTIKDGKIVERQTTPPAS